MGQPRLSQEVAALIEEDELEGAAADNLMMIDSDDDDDAEKHLSYHGHHDRDDADAPDKQLFENSEKRGAEQ